MRVSALLMCAALAVAAPAYSADEQGAANVELVKTYVKAVRMATFGPNPEQDLRPVAEKYVSEDYVEHTYLMEQPGREGYIQTMLKRAAARRASPAGAGGLTLDEVLALKERYIGDGDYVMWMTELPNAGSGPGAAPKLSFNMVRIVDGKVKEHWASG